MPQPISFRKYAKYAIIFVAIGLGTWLTRPGHKKVVGVRDFTAIRSSGVIHVATEYNKLSFFVDSDTISGYNYELVKAFARSIGVRADIHPITSEKERLDGLRNGTYDLIACNLQSTVDLKDSILLSSPILLTRQVLVQRKPHIGKAPYIKSQLDLAGKTLNIPKDSPSILRIRNLSNEIGDTIYIHEITKYDSEQLIYMVAHGDIDYAVCDENIAKGYTKQLPTIDIQTAISFTQFYSWGINKNSSELCKRLNIWLSQFKTTEAYKQIYRKYIK